MPKQENKEKIEKLTETFKKASSVAFVDYEGMDVSMVSELRSKLKEAGGSMLVSKNTFTKIAGKEAGLPKDALTDTVLSNQTAMVLGSDDPVSPIQALGKFIKEFELPQFKAGVVEGAFQDKDGLLKISNLPGKEQLQGQVVGSVGAPLYGLVGTLQGNLQKLIYILKTKSESQ